MAHWAEIQDGIVTRVIVADDDKQDWLVETFGGTWVQTSYNTRGGEHILGGEPLRYNFAGIGYTYDEARDAFIAPQPYDSWVLNEDTCLWEPPTPRPVEGDWEWDESAVAWVEVVEPSA